MLPSASAVARTASVSARLRSFAVSTVPIRASVSAAMIVPRSVRKSFAVNAPPVRERTCELTSAGVSGTRRLPRRYDSSGERGPARAQLGHHRGELLVVDLDECALAALARETTA